MPEQQRQEVERPDNQWLRALRRRLLRWYRGEARDLPWRGPPDAYKSWVSEIMLQQTQVATVARYFPRFMAAFPSVERLAAADESEVLRLWEGLGYYRRARQLHSAAQVIVERHGGQFPDEIDQVRALPGIGRYTAGAILSIAFDQRHPILEANTVRLYARLLAYDGDPVRAEGQQRLWQFATDVLPRRGVGELNQALMELGSLICTPKNPSCSNCPVATLCPTRAGGLQNSIPRAKPKQAFTAVHETAVVVWHRGRVLLRQCDDDERWAGLWDFPRVPGNTQTAAERRGVVERVSEQTGLAIELHERLTRIKHGVTRFRITLDCYQAKPRPGSRPHRHDALRWLHPDALESLPLSTTGREIARLVQAL